MKTILLKFAGPLQSWGTTSRFETRHTDFYPSKSAVVGMIAASLGLTREEQEKIAFLRNLDYAARIDQKGNLMRDYHIAQKYKPTGAFERTYVTNRYYLEDAVFVVAISGEDEMMEKIEEAILNPYFQPFLGRRSNPLTADFFLGTSSEDAITSLENLEWHAADWYKRENRNREFLMLDLYADAHLIEEGTVKYRQDRVKSFSQKNRQFGYRGEKKTRIKVKNDLFRGSTEEHDAFASVGGSNVSF